MKKNFAIKVDTYPFTFIFMIGLTDQEALNSLSKKYKMDLDQDQADYVLMDESMAGKAVHFGGSKCLIRLADFTDSPEDHGRLSHELNHALQFMMEWIGMKLTDETSEAYAYLDQFLTERFIKEIRDAKNKRTQKRGQKK